MAGEAGGTMDWCKISMLLGSCINLLALRRSLTATYFWNVNLEICINKSKDHFKRFYLRNYMKEVIRIKICLAKIFIEFFFNNSKYCQQVNVGRKSYQEIFCIKVI